MNLPSWALCYIVVFLGPILRGSIKKIWMIWFRRRQYSLKIWLCQTIEEQIKIADKHKTREIGTIPIYFTFLFTSSKESINKTVLYKLKLSKFELFVVKIHSFYLLPLKIFPRFLISQRAQMAQDTPVPRFEDPHCTFFYH